MSTPLPTAKPDTPRTRGKRARRAVLASLALFVAAIVALSWLFNSGAGRDLLLAQVVAKLPADAHLSWRAAEGPAAGPFTLRDVRFAWAGGEFHAAEVTLDPALQPLLSRQLRLDALQVRDAQLELARDDTPFELPHWPQDLPRIEPPLGLQADRIEVDGLRVRRGGDAVVVISRLRGGLAADTGQLHLERLQVDSDRGQLTVHGDYRPRDDYRTQLDGTWILPAQPDRPPARVEAHARGTLAAMTVQLRGVAPGPFVADLSVRGRDMPRWRLHTSAEGFDPALFTGAEPGTGWYARLDGDGEGGNARLEGQASRGDFAVRVLPSRVQLDDQHLELQAVALELLGGRATLAGRVDFAATAARWRGRVQARGLRWGEGADAVRADATLGLAGGTQQWAAIGTATLAHHDQHADLDLDVRGDDQRLRVHRLRARSSRGQLEGDGTLAWSPALAYAFHANLAGFDPAMVLPGWPGAVDGRIDLDGTRRGDGGLRTHVTLRELGGQLRARPLRGSAELDIDEATDPRGHRAFAGQVDLQLGDSRIEAHGRLADALALDARFAPLHLADLLPAAGGRVDGELHLRGARDAPDIDVDLSGERLQLGALRADHLQARGHLPRYARSGAGVLRVEGTGLALGWPVARLDVEARGALERMQVDAHGEGEAGRIELRGALGRQGTGWQGTLATLQLAPTQGAAWRLEQPVDWRWAAAGGRVGTACLHGDGDGRVCLEGEWPGRGVVAHGSGVSLALLQSWLPLPAAAQRYEAEGALAFEAQAKPAADGHWHGTATVTSPSGGFAPRRQHAGGRAAPTDRMRYDELVLHAQLDGAGLHATLGAGFDGHGRVDAQFATGWVADSALDGTVAIATDQVGWLEWFSPDIVAPRGRLQGTLRLAGTRAQPRLGGDAELSDFQAEVPALGLRLRDGTLRMDAQPDGDTRVVGQLRSGEGVLHVQGTLGGVRTGRPLRLHVTGEDVLAADTPQLHAVVAPDLVVQYASGDAAIAVAGKVLVPQARIALEILDTGALGSSDVVVLDPVDADATPGLPLDLDLQLIAGDDVQMSGYGLDGSMRGQLHARARPGHEVLASGALDIDGHYSAYGQRLEITHGRLLWANVPVVDPAVDLRAERRIGDVVAGIDVSGRASAPVATVWTDPASTPSEAISWLALGRPLAQASDEEGQRVGAARSALAVGGTLLMAQVGSRLGLDEAGVSNSRALGGEVIGAGKYLSPRLFVGYGVSLVGSGQVLTLRYLLRKGFDIEIESSTVENRASANWRLEK